jgi:YbbR domain-containing protein
LRRVGTPVALAAVSLLAAVVLWVVVTEAENPSKVGFLGGAVPVVAVNVPEGLAVASIRDPVVSIRVSAPEDTFGRLTVADFRAEVDLSGVRQTTSEQRVIARVVGRRDVGVTEVSPAVVTVVLEPVESVQVPLRPNLVGAPPQGYAVGEVEPSPAQVRVTGAQSLVRLVSSGAVDVNLTGLRASIRQQFPIVARDARGADVTGVRVEPSTADVRVNIVQQEVTLTLTVLPTVQGFPADGHSLVAVAPDPPAIAVSGPLELLQAVGSISTEPIDVSGLRADTTRTVRLRLPAGLMATRDSVTVRLRVAAARGEVLVPVAPQVTDLPSEMRATLQTTSVTVRLAGEVPTLRSLPAGAVRATVSAAGLGEGVQVGDVTVTAPDGVQVLSVDPLQVVFVLRR